MYLVSLTLFAVLFLTITVWADVLVGRASHRSAFLLFLNLMAYGVYAFAGFLTALMMKRRVLVNGIIGGVLSAILAIAAFGVAGADLFGMAFLLINAAVLGGFGGFCALAWNRRKEGGSRL